ncbi:hypothetical protein Tco_1274170 [Tanacetum coccineum]
MVHLTGLNNTQLHQIINTSLLSTYPSNIFNLNSPQVYFLLITNSIPQLEIYLPKINQQSEFSQQDSGLIVPVFQKGDDPIDAHQSHDVVFYCNFHLPENKLYLLRGTSKDLTLGCGCVCLFVFGEQVEAILENRGRLFATTAKGKVTCLDSAPNQREKGMIHGLKIRKCCCTSSAHGQILNEKELAFLADPDIPEGQGIQTVIYYTWQSYIQV